MSSPINSNTSLENLAAIVAEALKSAGIDVVLTGGAVVSIYTHNEYESYDLDFINQSWGKRVDDVMQRLGFSKSRSRHWEHPETPYFVEFPGNTLEIGSNSGPKQTTLTTLKTPHGSLRLLSPTDCIKDRLAAFYHWNDRQGLDQALAVAQKQKFHMKKIEQWSAVEGHQEKFHLFKQLWKKQSKHKRF